MKCNEKNFRYLGLYFSRSFCKGKLTVQTFTLVDKLQFKSMDLSHSNYGIAY